MAQAVSKFLVSDNDNLNVRIRENDNNRDTTRMSTAKIHPKKQISKLKNIPDLGPLAYHDYVRIRDVACKTHLFFLRKAREVYNCSYLSTRSLLQYLKNRNPYCTFKRVRRTYFNMLTDFLEYHVAKLSHQSHTGKKLKNGLNETSDIRSPWRYLKLRETSSLNDVYDPNMSEKGFRKRTEDYRKLKERELNEHERNGNDIEHEQLDMKRPKSIRSVDKKEMQILQQFINTYGGGSVDFKVTSSAKPRKICMPCEGGCSGHHGNNGARKRDNNVRNDDFIMTRALFFEEEIRRRAITLRVIWESLCQNSKHKFKTEYHNIRFLIMRNNRNNTKLVDSVTNLPDKFKNVKVLHFPKEPAIIKKCALIRIEHLDIIGILPTYNIVLLILREFKFGEDIFKYVEKRWMFLANYYGCS